MDLKSQHTLIDLSQSLTEDAPVWPGNTKFSQILKTDYPQGCRVYDYCQAAGVGTHIDAPCHFISGGRSIAELSLTELLAPACVIDVSAKVANDPDYAISVKDIELWEAKYGIISPQSLVLALTGWSSRWPDPITYCNQDEQGIMHFPGFSSQAAELLVQREILGVGIDTLSPDPGIGLNFATHQVLLGANKYIIENLTNLALLPPLGAFVIALPLKIAAGTEAGARVVALCP